MEGKFRNSCLKIGGEIYLLECQSYDDGSMAIRIVEYAFIVAAALTAQMRHGQLIEIKIRINNGYSKERPHGRFF